MTSSCPYQHSTPWTRKIELIMQGIVNPLNKPPRNGDRVVSWPVSDLQSGNVQPGEYCSKFDMVFPWTESHIRGEELEKLRFIGDSLCENVLEELNIKPEDDALEVFLAADVDKHPACAALRKQCTKLPDWLDVESAKIGQQFFVSHSPFLAKMLLHMGLVPGYGSTKINQVLSSTRYLIGELDDTFKRVMETALCVTEFMLPGTLEPMTGEGWKCAMRVRFLHGKVRRRLTKSVRWNVQEWGIPINQEDLIGTLMAFSTTMVHASRAVIGISEQEAQGLMMIWRYIGHLLGILDEFNPHTEKQGTAFLQSLLLHQFNPDESSRRLATHTLKSVENRTVEGWSLPQHQALVRLLMGPSYAEEMGQPPVQPLHFLFHLAHFGGDIIYSRIIIQLPFIGEKIVQANWEIRRRMARNVLSGQRLSIYSQKMLVRDESVGEFSPSSRVQGRKTLESFLQFDSWFEYFAFHSVKVWNLLCLGTLSAIVLRCQLRRQIL